ncbi:hypothetical protein [Streptomyces sp. B6B3]|uniref:hypothetical protein n=1 Tax=Streptomyces sp. B6B3 TaxID=3153570 RepID=UPI00325FDB1A
MGDELGEGCGDTVPTAAVKTFLESDHISVEVPEEADGRGSDVVRCDIRPAAITSAEEKHASVSVVISSTEDAGEYLVPQSISGSETAPFGHGWVGTYGPDSTNAGVATLLLECPEQPGGGLMVLVSGVGIRTITSWWRRSTSSWPWSRRDWRGRLTRYGRAVAGSGRSPTR